MTDTVANEAKNVFLDDHNRDFRYIDDQLNNAYFCTPYVLIMPFYCHASKI